MTSTRDMPSWAYKAGLLLTTIIWGSAFVVGKDALEVVAPGWLLVIRFGVSGVVLTLLLRGHLREHLDRRHLVAGLLIGATGGAAYLLQHVGLAVSTPAKSAFLTATYCVMVPFMHWAATRTRPRSHNFAAAALCVVGVYLVTTGEGGLSDLGSLFVLDVGDVLTLLCAVLFALEIEVIDHYAPTCDALTLSVVQLFPIAVLCLVDAIARAEPLPAASVLGPGVVAELAYLTFAAAAFTTISQNVCQQHVESSQAALLMSLESVFGVIFSVVFYHELLTPAMLVGFVAIFASVLMSELVG